MFNLISKIAFAIVLLSTPLLVVAQTDVYFADIWTGQGTRLKDGVLVVEGKRIVAVGPRGDVEIPHNASIHDFAGKSIFVSRLVRGSRCQVRTAGNSRFQPCVLGTGSPYQPGYKNCVD